MFCLCYTQEQTTIQIKLVSGWRAATEWHSMRYLYMCARSACPQPTPPRHPASQLRAFDSLPLAMPTIAQVGPLLRHRNHGRSRLLALLHASAVALPDHDPRLLDRSQRHPSLHARTTCLPAAHRASGRHHRDGLHRTLPHRLHLCPRLLPLSVPLRTRGAPADGSVSFPPPALPAVAPTCIPLPPAPPSRCQAGSSFRPQACPSARSPTATWTLLAWRYCSTNSSGKARSPATVSGSRRPVGGEIAVPGLNLPGAPLRRLTSPGARTCMTGGPIIAASHYLGMVRTAGPEPYCTAC